jgi:hypothetical protein
VLGLTGIRTPPAQFPPPPIPLAVIVVLLVLTWAA